MPSWPDDPKRFVQREGGDGHLVIFLNGILTVPGDQFAWTDLAERWFLRQTTHDVDSYEYFHSALFGLLREGREVEEARGLIDAYRKAWQREPVVHLVGHSRGCEIARRLLVEQDPKKQVQVRSAHFFAPAVEADFEKNGLNEALQSGRLGRVEVYASTADAVLRYVAGASCGLYGRMGYTGPLGIAPEVMHRVRTVVSHSFGHSDWFAPANFEGAMRMVELELDEVPL